MIRRFSVLFLTILLCVAFCGCGGNDKKELPLTEVTSDSVSSAASVDVDLSAMELSFTERELKGEYATSSATVVNFGGGAAEIDGEGAQYDGKLVINSEGTYLLSGVGSSYIEVAAGENDKVQLVLCGLEISNSEGPALYVKSADKVFLTLSEGTENKLSDGGEYVFSEDDGLDGAIFSRADLCINGKGTLTVNGNNKHGIVSKDDLVLTGGNIAVTAKNVALDGKDCVKITETALSVSAGTDGIRSSNTEEGNRGYIYIKNGTLNVTSENDAFQAQTALFVENGDITVLAGGGSVNASYSENGWNKGWMMPPGYSQEQDSTAESAKGLKAGALIKIEGGNFSLDTADDALHSNGDIEITSGSICALAGDDGIHADSKLNISDGDIKIEKSYEGIEATDIVLSGGKTNVTASDDGLNAAGGNDESAMGGRPGMGAFSGDSGSILISGGTHNINASGDGVDSNGSITVTGGTTLVSGPTNSGNGALDYAGSATVTGGTFVAVGSSGMATGFTDAENQGAILCDVGNHQSGSEIKVVTDSGKVILSFIPEKAYSSLVVSAEGIKAGETYKITVDGETATEITMDSLVYGSSGMGGHGGFGNMGGPGGPGGPGGFGKK